MKIAILGSCVTRDMVEYLPGHAQLAFYFARTSLVSLMAEAVPVSMEQIHADREFNRKVVLWDMTKTFWETLEAARPDVLILDFIDERFDLWQRGPAIVTRSTYLSQSGVEQEVLSDFSLLRRGAPRTHDLWTDACTNFVKRIEGLCGKIILHRSLWAERFYLENEAIIFDEETRAQAIAANQWLNAYYDHFLSVCPSAVEIRVEQDLCVSDYAHKWGRDFFHYGKNYYKRLAELVTMHLGNDVFSEKVSSHDALRSLEKWPSAKFSWVSLRDFLEQTHVQSGIHSILLEGGLVFDIYIDIKQNAPAYIYFHGNCPRAPNFKLPVFSGANVLESLNVTRIVPSDPVLLMDDSLELSWHAGNSVCNLQDVYKAIFTKVLDFAAPPEVVFWGGSGGGFAALYYSFYYPGSTAMVWNPQIDFLRYSEDAVNKYLVLGFGSKLGAERPVAQGIEHDLANLYRNGHQNRVIFIQNDEDWHVEEHLVPFLDAIGVDSSSLGQSGHNGLIASNFYLFLGNFSQGHEPPSNVEIHCALQECYFSHGDPARFDFARLVSRKHHVSNSAPEWVSAALLERQMAYFRPDWPHYSSSPAVDLTSPYHVKLSTGIVIDFSTPNGIDWGMDFDRDPSDNVHELYSLGYVGRLLSAYSDTKNPEFLNVALQILDSFFTFIENKDCYELMMNNRGFSSSDHSISIRANVCVKFLQLVAVDPNLRSKCECLIGKVVCHLWNIGDHFTNQKNIYPSNHGIMSCLTLAQIANQFGNLPYIGNYYLRLANKFLANLVGSSFDRDGWCDENTVGYHSFICRLLRDYVEYCSKNQLLMKESAELESYLRKGERALSYCVRQDGSIPPIGDSPRYRANLTSINSSKFFAESGFLIIKDDDLHLSFICGSRSDNHKQVDDSSVSLHYGGEDLIIDGGSYCYDYNDPHRKYLVSFRGHSGIYSKAAENLSPRDYLKRRRYASIEEYSEGNKNRFARARYGLDLNDFTCERRLLVDYAGGIVIADRASSSDAETTFNQSFLLAPHLKLVFKQDGHLIFEGEKYGLILSQMNPCDLHVENGKIEPEIAGWYSVDWRKVKETTQLRFVQRGKSAHYLTRLQIFEKDKFDAGEFLKELPGFDDLSKIYSR